MREKSTPKIHDKNKSKSQNQQQKINGKMSPCGRQIFKKQNRQFFDDSKNLKNPKFQLWKIILWIFKKKAGLAGS